MRLGIVGGGLQGLEAAYLARRAGWETRLLDRRADAPARGLADSFALGDAGDPAVLDRELRGVDLLLPALEDTPVLEAHRRLGRPARDPAGLRSGGVRGELLQAGLQPAVPQPGDGASPAVAGVRAAGAGQARRVERQPRGAGVPGAGLLAVLAGRARGGRGTAGSRRSTWRALPIRSKCWGLPARTGPCR